MCNNKGCKHGLPSASRGGVVPSALGRVAAQSANLGLPRTIVYIKVIFNITAKTPYHKMEIGRIEQSILDDIKQIPTQHMHVPDVRDILCKASAFCSAGNYIHCLRYMQSHGFPCDAFTTLFALANGHLECLTFVHSNGCGWDFDHLDRQQVVGYSIFHRIDVIPWQYWKMSDADKQKHQTKLFACLKYAQANGCKFSTVVCQMVADCGNVELIQYCKEHGGQWDEDTMSNMVHYGYLNCLKYFHSIRVPWNEDTTKRAAERGNLDCLKFAHENGCPWDVQTTIECAGNLRCLQYVYENGCPVDETVFEKSISNYRLDCVDYALRCNFPYNKDKVLHWSSTVLLRRKDYLYLEIFGTFRKWLFSFIDTGHLHPEINEVCKSKKEMFDIYHAFIRHQHQKDLIPDLLNIVIEYI